MSVSKSWFAAAFAGSLIWIAGFADPVCAEESATAIAPPAVRFATANACRILNPTFAPDAAREGVIEARYPGGGKLSLLIAAPCPMRSGEYDI